MLSLTTEYLSCDHTFKLLKHVGLMRGSRWVAQYDSLFIMQGEILFWQLTSGTAFSAVHAIPWTKNKCVSESSEDGFH